ncbi:MAG: hypothetical protein P8Q94_06300 [Candidatus Poseidoniaceae archaeon]|nr:hypothetical protein [Candidatus Poseidoniaceae archaeon]
MAEPVLEGASLPDGIEVDEAAAYFGVTESSDIVHTLMSMERNQSISQFFTMVSDIILKPGEFDFEEASQALNCEGGEIYYLVSGHLGLMSFGDPILHYLGLPDSLGKESKNGKPNIDQKQFDSLNRLANPMNMLKVLAIANNTGGSQEVMKYYLTMSELMINVESNVVTLTEISDEFDASLDVIGHTLPISVLAGSSIDLSKAIIDAPAAIKKEAPKVAQQVEQSTKLPEVEQVSPLPEEVSIPSVPLPGQSIPAEITEDKIESIIETELTDRKAAKATDNAFEGAFGMAAEANTLQVEDSVQADEVEEDLATEAIIEEMVVEEQETEEPFHSAAEMFIQSDTDDDGNLSVEELSQATGLSIAEAEEIHQTADLDEDGSMSLSEFIASPVVEKVASNLPRPVAPVRRPVNLSSEQPNNVQQSQGNPVNNPQTQQAFPQQPISRPIPPQNVSPQPSVRQQPIGIPQPSVRQQPIGIPQPTKQAPLQQNQWNQPIQPTIRSGVMCRSCGIGIDPYWRFCPVCGGQNLG